MAELKTKKNSRSVDMFIDQITDKNQKQDSLRINKLIESLSGEKGKMWGDSIIGYIDVHLKYESGREIDWFKIGFAPRKGKISIYLNCNFEKKYADIMSKLGKYQAGIGCLYIKKLDDIDFSLLSDLIKKSLTA